MSEPTSEGAQAVHRGRRAFLGLAAGLGVGLLSRRAWAPTPVAKRTAETLIQPPEIRASDGRLVTTITAAPGRVQLDSFSFPGFLYNGSYCPPLLRMNLGDTMQIAFRNQLADPSNLHFHGMSVSPQGRADNVFLHIHSGQGFDYEVPIPANGRQGPGLFWYHPHGHGFVTRQIRGGLSGGLIVEGFERLYPIVTGIPERVLLLKHASTGSGDDTISINGQINPVLQMRPGEPQFWRIGNIGASLFIKARVEGIQLYLLATDGHPLSQPRRVDELFLGPGERAELLAVASDAGEYALRTRSFQNQAWRPPSPVQHLASIHVDGPQMQRATLDAEILGQRLQEPHWFDDVRAAPIARRRTLVYSRTDDRSVFMIDGRIMDEGRIDQVVKFGDTEEWTIVNTDQQFHSFHIHQTPFAVTEINGQRQDEDSLRDTASMLPATADGPSTLKVVIPFTDPVIVGKFVYHCHDVDHEDKGMMGIVEVVA